MSQSEKSIQPEGRSPEFYYLQVIYDFPGLTVFIHKVRKSMTIISL